MNCIYTESKLNHIYRKTVEKTTAITMRGKRRKKPQDSMFYTSPNFVQKDFPLRCDNDPENSPLS